MGKLAAGESSEEKEDHPQKESLRNNEGPSETSVNSVSEEQSKTTGTVTAPSQPTMAEDAEEYIKPILKDGELILEVECGQNKALLYLSKLCQGSKGPCIYFQGSWLSPNEFQYVSGRETAKDWKRSIRHHGKSLKLLLAKGILSVHPTVCDCEGCRTSSTLNRNRNGTKKKHPASKDDKVKTDVGDVSKSGDVTCSPDVVTKKESKKSSKKSATDKPISPLRESKSTNIMKSPLSATTEDRAPKVQVVVPCPVIPTQFTIPKVPVLSPVKPTLFDGTTKTPLLQKDQTTLSPDKVKVEISPMVIGSPVKAPVEKHQPIEAAQSQSSPKSDTDKPREAKSPKVQSASVSVPSETIKQEAIKQETIKQEPKQAKVEPNRHYPDSPKTEASSSTPDKHRKSPEFEKEKTTPKSIPAFMLRLGSEVPAFRPPEASPDSAIYSDYMRMFPTAHHMMQPSPIDMYNLRASDPSLNPALHPYHGYSMFNPSPFYPKDPVLISPSSVPITPITAPCFSPMQMISQRLPYPSPIMDYPRPFGYIPSPSSLPYPCSSLTGLKRHHPEFEAASDIASKRLRLDYPISDFRLDSYPMCSPSYPYYYDPSLLSEEYRRKRLEESFNCGKDLSNYMNPYLNKPGGQCTCRNRADDIRNWSVEDVCMFISRLDGCGLYSETFREQRVDGRILVLLTTDHMIKSLGLKLGPAVLIAEAVTKTLQEARSQCDVCRKMTMELRS